MQKRLASTHLIQHKATSWNTGTVQEMFAIRWHNFILDIESTVNVTSSTEQNTLRTGFMKKYMSLQEYPIQ